MATTTAAPNGALPADILGSAPPEQRPDYARQELENAREQLGRVRDFVAGTDAVRRAGPTHLPKWEGESSDTYKARTKYSSVYAATGRALIASLGMVFSTPPALVPPQRPKRDDPEGSTEPAPLPDALEALAKDADGMGHDLATVARGVFRDMLTDGLAGLLVDVPPRLDGTVPDASTRVVARLLPYRRDQILNWRIGLAVDPVQGGTRLALTRLVLEERVETNAGAYGVTATRRFRELLLVRTDDPAAGTDAERPLGVRYVLWDRVERPGEAEPVRFVAREAGWVLDGTGRSFGVIPFAVGYGSPHTAPFVADSPLLALADTNADYYRTASDRRWSMALSLAPILVLVGREPGDDGRFPQVAVGPGTSIDVPRNGDVKYVAAPADAMAASQVELERLRVEMATLSLDFLLRRDTAPETATGRAYDAQAGHASLALAALGLQDMLDQGVGFSARFASSAAAPVEALPVRVQTTYDVRQLDAPTLTALNTIRKDGGLTRGTFLKLLASGGVLPESIDLEEEELTLAAQDQAVRDAAAVNGNGDPNAGSEA